MKEILSKEDFIFHSTHGLCRVSEITRSVQTKELLYTLLPANQSRERIRFLITENALETSGFNKLISNADGHAILEYFKFGKNEAVPPSSTWKLAKLIREESVSKETIKDSKRRQHIHQAVKGLAKELAFVLHLPLTDIAAAIQKNLSRTLPINPLVLTALLAADRD